MTDKCKWWVAIVHHVDTRKLKRAIITRGNDFHKVRIKVLRTLKPNEFLHKVIEPEEI